MFTPENVEVAPTFRSCKRRERRRTWWVWGSIGLLVPLALFVTFLTILESSRSDTIVKWNQIQVGDTEVSVRSRLGEPNIEYARESAPTDYYVSGYRRRERPITNRVLIYMGADLVLYVWVDDAGRVEELFRGVS
jgi:hypothetical protein